MSYGLACREVFFIRYVAGFVLSFNGSGMILMLVWLSYSCMTNIHIRIVTLQELGDVLLNTFCADRQRFSAQVASPVDVR